MRILLNATDNELGQLGGDFTLYRDWLRLQSEDLAFRLVGATRLRRWHLVLRKGFEKLCGTWQPVLLRRRLFLASRFLYLPQGATGAVDLIFSHLLFPFIRGGGVPIVWSSQGISPAIYYERYNRGQWTVEDVAFIYRVLGRKADALVISTETCARNVIHWCPELSDKIHVVPGPVFADASSYLVKPSMQDGVIRLLFVGVEARRKGLPEVVEAFRILRSTYTHLHLDIVSRPSVELRKRIEELSGVSLYLSSPDVNVKALMARADIFLMPTHADTYALAAVEAMAHQCAVIVSDLDPLPEVVPDGQVGFAVPPGDVGKLVEKLKVLLTASDRLRQFQANARQRYLSLHAPSAVAKRLEQVFEPLLP
jgi:glycosyltransferase involved in cell wall biosynthesis